MFQNIIENIFKGLPEQPNIDEFKRVCALSEVFKGNPMHTITLLTALLNTDDDAFELNRRLKLSAYERELSKFLVNNKDASKNIDELL